MSLTRSTAPDVEPTSARPRSTLRTVGVPTEHGGWGLTAEPVLLGLLVAPSIAGAALGAAAVLAFLARTPLKVVLVDRWRGRSLPRTRGAARLVAAEGAAIGALVLVTALRAGRGWWAPLAFAAPLVIIQLSFDMRSRSRRLLPELCGAVGVASVAAAIARAGGASWTVAAGCWAVLAARAIGSIPFARTQVQRVHGRNPATVSSDAAQAVTIAVGVGGWVAGLVPWPAAVVLAAVAGGELAWVRARPPRVRLLGFAQLAIGLAVTLTTAAAIRIRIRVR